MGRDPRLAPEQTPATYTGLLDPIRKALRQGPTGVKPALFSANSEGRLPDLQRRRRDLQPTLAMMAGIATTLRAVRGASGSTRRCSTTTLGGSGNSKDISEVSRDGRWPRREAFFRHR